MSPQKAQVLPLIFLLLAACGGTFPPPNDRMARAEAAVRGAQEVGATNNPQAALHLKLATEQIDKAKALMNDGQNRRADLTLQRAEADAELANLLAKEAKERRDAEAAIEQMNKIKK
jgi:Spy/CpxP family protein refolding chaperone